MLGIVPQLPQVRPDRLLQTSALREPLLPDVAFVRGLGSASGWSPRGRAPGPRCDTADRGRAFRGPALDQTVGTSSMLSTGHREPRSRRRCMAPGRPAPTFAPLSTVAPAPTA